MFWHGAIKLLRQDQLALARFGHVDELAAACVLLAGEAGGFISGQVIHVNGGHYMI